MNKNRSFYIKYIESKTSGLIQIFYLEYVYRMASPFIKSTKTIEVKINNKRPNAMGNIDIGISDIPNLQETLDSSVSCSCYTFIYD